MAARHALVVGAVAGAVALAVGTAPSAGSSPCGRAPAGSTTLTVRQGSTRRSAIVHVPPAYTGSRPVPLVLNLHGSGSTADQQRLFTGMNQAADAHGFVVAYPQAAIPDGSGYDWNVPGQPLVGGRKVPHGSPSDVDFVGRLLSAVEGRYCIDSHRVYATGFSGGARMTAVLACELSALAAIAPVSGLRLPEPCPSRRPVPVVAFHGAADPIDPYAGHGQPYWTYSVPEAAKRWASHDGCGKRPATGAQASGVKITSYRGCKAGAAVELYTIAGEGHEWPGGPALPPAFVRILGPQSSAVNANAVMWKFFTAHPLR